MGSTGGELAAHVAAHPTAQPLEDTGAVAAELPAPHTDTHEAAEPLPHVKSGAAAAAAAAVPEDVTLAGQHQLYEQHMAKSAEVAAAAAEGPTVAAPIRKKAQLPAVAAPTAEEEMEEPEEELEPDEPLPARLLPAASRKGGTSREIVQAILRVLRDSSSKHL